MILNAPQDLRFIYWNFVILKGGSVLNIETVNVSDHPALLRFSMEPFYQRCADDESVLGTT